MKSHGALLGQESITHSYPHCWRCHNATIFRSTEQWFVGMERNDLRARTLKAIKAVKWMPAWGEERISNMIATRPDWCISRQRVWGVPIVVFYCENCQEPLTDRKILDHVVKLFAEYSADIWYERSAAELIGPGVKCSRCGGAEFRKETDILDVWLDSGVSHLAVLTPENGNAVAIQLVPGGRRSVSRLVPQLAAWWAWLSEVKRRTGNAPLTAGRWTNKGARCPSRSASASSRKR